MQGLFLFLVWLALVLLGLRAPFVFGLGYIWVDLFTPQFVNPAVMSLFPVSMIMGAGAVGAYLLADRRAPPGARLGIVLPLIWATWITLTTTWAEVPDDAWAKWDWACKTVLFSAFMPFLFRSRVQIEAAILVIVLSIAAHAIPFGAKTLIGGGGYGRQLGLIRMNSSLGESSTLAVDCVAILPLLAWLARHGQIAASIVPRQRLLRLGYLGLAGAAVLTTLGTYARAGLVSLGVFAAFHWWGSRHKILLAAAFCVLGAGLFALMGDRYTQRMSTIADPTHEQSAATRLAVWNWTYHYALEHPLGGGFDVYRINKLDLAIGEREVEEQARAFHSMYFEVLGEHGFVGAGIFASLLATFFVSAWRIMRRARRIAELAWMADLAKAMLVSGCAYCCGAAFIGVAFQPFHYYLFALTVALLNHYARATADGRLALQAIDQQALPARV
jgi:putative inorganic carbon (HCO3(-)) transporter